jgi:hypothetical protein
MEILRNTQGRVFVSTGELDKFKYYGAMSVGPIEKSLPAIESVFTINSKGNVVKVAEVKDHNVQLSSASLTGYIPISAPSSLEKLINKNGANIQIHYGTCSNPSDFNSFDSALILRGVNLTNYSLSEPSTLTPNKAIIQETANISIDESYRIFTPSFQQVFGEAGIISMLGVDFADSNYCSIPYKNLDILIAMYNVSGSMRFSYSFDNGVSWSQHPTLFALHGGGATSSTFKIVENKMYWSYVYGTETYVSVADVGALISDSTIVSTTLFYHPLYAVIRDISAAKNYLWCVGGTSASFMMRISLADYTVEILDDDTNFTGEQVNAIDALNDNFVVAVGENNNFSLYQNGEFYLSTVGIDSMAFLSDVKVFSEHRWLIASDMGIYITINGGLDWTKTYTVQNSTKFIFYDNLVGYAANTDGVFRTMDGGFTWKRIYISNWTNIYSVIMDKQNPNNIFLLENFYLYSAL